MLFLLGTIAWFIYKKVMPSQSPSDSAFIARNPGAGKSNIFADGMTFKKEIRDGSLHFLVKPATLPFPYGMVIFMGIGTFVVGGISLGDQVYRSSGGSISTVVFTASMFPAAIIALAIVLYRYKQGLREVQQFTIANGIIANSKFSSTRDNIQHISLRNDRDEKMAYKTSPSSTFVVAGSGTTGSIAAASTGAVMGVAMMSSAIGANAAKKIEKVSFRIDIESFGKANRLVSYLDETTAKGLLAEIAKEMGFQA